MFIAWAVDSVSVKSKEPDAATNKVRFSKAARSVADYDNDVSLLAVHMYLPLSGIEDWLVISLMGETSYGRENPISSSPKPHLT